MSVLLNVRMSKIMLTPIKLGASTYPTYTNCQTLSYIVILTVFFVILRLGLSHLREHKFKHGFQDSLNPICSCGNDIETSAHFLLHCPHYSNERSTFLNTIRNINRHIFDKNDLQITETPLYDDSSLDDKNNTLILNATIDFSLPNYENFGNPDIASNNFINRLDCAVIAVACFKTVRVKNNTSEWFDGKTADKIHTRDKLYIRFKLTKLYVEKEIYKETQNIVQNFFRRKNKAYPLRKN